MIWQGTKCSSKEQLKDLQEYVNSELAKQYQVIDIVNDRTCFLLNSGEIFSVTCMFGKNICALCTEYAASVDDMKKYFTTDGDLYPLEDYETPEDIIENIINEIEE